MLIKCQVIWCKRFNAYRHCLLCNYSMVAFTLSKFDLYMCVTAGDHK
jgi:hypothetical protein